jgi:predicted MFS family arabinose efflux permease
MGVSLFLDYITNIIGFSARIAKLMNNISKNLQSIFKRYPSGVWLISLVGVLNSVAISLSLPFMSLYLYEKRGISMAMVGVIILVVGICALFAQLLAGMITDKLGRRPLLLTTLSSSVVLYSLMAFSISKNAPVLVIILIYALTRSALSMQRPAINSIVADLAPKEKLTETYGLMIMGGNLGFAAGPAIGGLLAAYLTYGWLFALGALVLAGALILIIFNFKESFHGSTERVSIGSIFTAAADRRLLLFTGICLILYLASSQLISTLSVYTVSHAGFTTAQFGTLLTLNGLMITLVQYPASRLMSRFSIATVLTTGALLYAVGYFAVGFVGSYWLCFGAIAVVTSGEICCTPSIMTVVGRLASSNWRGRYMAFIGMSETLGMSLGPLMGGLLLDKFSGKPLIVWGITAVLAVCAAIGFSLFGRRINSQL